jgi:hypothetical protein
MHAARKSKELRSRSKDGASITKDEAKRVKDGVKMLVEYHSIIEERDPGFSKRFHTCQ